MARTASQQRLRPVLGVVAVLVTTAALLIAGVGAAYAIHQPELGENGTGPVFDQLWEFGTWLVAIGLAAPAVLLVVRWVDRRPPGSVSSVAGRIRWRWLAKCVLIAAAVFAAWTAVILLLEPPAEQDGGIKWELVAGAVVVGAALIPLQAAGEEYLFRGYLAQAAGVFLSNPWVPAVALSVLFGLAHGTAQGTWLFIDRVGFGLVAAWLTIRTGGLEAAVAVHFAGNLAVTISVALDGDFGSALVGPEVAARPLEVAINLLLMAAFAALIARLAQRDRIATAWTDPRQ